ncbi:MAG: hypothetical protein ACOX7P_00620 [Oscillospiraceae bacterium]|jgi:hypothetical protein
MSLKGIDAQIMTQRATDFVKNASAANKRNELMQDYMALQRKAEDEARDNAVSEIEQKDEVRITRERGGSGGEEAGGREKKEKQDKEEGGGEGQPQALSGGIGSSIDIIV